MNVPKRLLTVAIAAAVLLVPVTALAHGEGEESERDPDLKPEIVRIRHEAREKAEKERESADDRKVQIRQEVETRKLEIKQDICERKQEKLNTLLPKLSQGATSVKESMDKIYIRVVNFYEKGQLTVDNYDELVSNVEVAKANAEEALEVIKSETFELDCTNPNVGEQLDGFRLSVKEAKQPLKEYKKSLVELISAMKSASAQANDDNTEGSGNE